MAKKLKVLVPRTKDGKNLVYDENKQPIYDSHILELTARAGLESISAKLPEHLRYKISVVDDEDKVIEISSLVNEQIAAKDAEIEALKKQLEAAAAKEPTKPSPEPATASVTEPAPAPEPAKPTAAAGAPATGKK